MPVNSGFYFLFMAKKKQFARERAAKLLEENKLSLGPEGRTYQLHDKETGELLKDTFTGVDVDAGLFSRNRRQNRLIGKELMRQRALQPRERTVTPTTEETETSTFIPEKLPEFQFTPSNYRGVTLGESTPVTSTPPPTVVKPPAVIETSTELSSRQADVPETVQSKTRENVGDIDLNVPSFNFVTDRDHGLIGIPTSQYTASKEKEVLKEQPFGLKYDTTPYLGELDKVITRQLGRNNRNKYRYAESVKEKYGDSPEALRQWYYDTYPDDAQNWFGIWKDRAAEAQAKKSDNTPPSFWDMFGRGLKRTVNPRGSNR